mmetsp:Transcript_5170/g.9024  ORF Transcript_5170/g.9024 Transcript_5170/m.9024 type:complete len:94 (+) Transcript_5170:572-853(+)
MYVHRHSLSQTQRYSILHHVTVATGTIHPSKCNTKCSIFNENAHRITESSQRLEADADDDARLKKRNSEDRLSECPIKTVSFCYEDLRDFLKL